MTSTIRKVDKLDRLMERAGTMESGSVGWVYLTAPLTSTQFDGDAFSTTGATLIDLSAAFGLPANIRAVYLYVLAKDSASVTSETAVGFAPDTTNVQKFRIGTENDIYSAFTPIIPCNADGDIYYVVDASGAGTLDLIIRVFAYLPGNADGGVLVGQTPVNHDHSGDAGDGGTFDAANLTSGAATDGHVLTADGAGGAAWEAVTGGSGASAFIDLTDTPASYTGQAGKYPKVNAGETALEFDTPAGGAIVREAIFTKPGELYVGVGVTRYYNLTGAALTISKVHAAVNTAPTGTSLIVDVNIDGTTIFTTQANRAAIAAGANTGFSTTMDVTNWPNGSYITADLDQVGSTNPGSDLTVTIVC